MTLGTVLLGAALWLTLGVLAHAFLLEYGG